jgi:hypothetical protein
MTARSTARSTIASASNCLDCGSNCPPRDCVCRTCLDSGGTDQRQPAAPRSQHYLDEKAATIGKPRQVLSGFFDPIEGSERVI